MIYQINIYTADKELYHRNGEFRKIFASRKEAQEYLNKFIWRGENWTYEVAPVSNKELDKLVEALKSSVTDHESKLLFAKRQVERYKSLVTRSRKLYNAAIKK